MKIDIGSGKVLGTKRVSPNGQISGFTEFAGREVLVILPEEEGEVDVRLSARDVVKEIQVATNEHMKIAFHQYKDLRRRFETPEHATKEFLARKAPRSFQGLYEKVESFVKEQLDKAEEKVEERLARADSTPATSTPQSTPASE